MTNYLKQDNKIDLVAKFFLLIGVFFIPFSTALMTIGLTAAMVLAILSGHWREKIHFIKSNAALWLPLLLFLLVLLSTLHGFAPWHTRFKMVNKYHQLLALPFLAWLMRDEIMRRLTLKIFLIAMLVLWLLSYLAVYLKVTIIRGSNPSALFHDHISIGILSAFSIFVFAHLFRLSTGRYKYFYGLAIAIACWYMLFMNSGRTAYLVFFALLILFTWQVWHWKGFIAGCVLTLVLIVAAFSVSHVFRAGSTNIARDYQQYQSNDDKPADGSASIRLALMKLGIELIKQHPVLGVGTGSFATAASQLPGPKPISGVDNASNDFINVPAQVGLAGLIVLLCMYGMQWRKSKELLYPYQAVAQLLLASMIVGGLFNPLLTDTVEANFYSVVAALCFAAFNSAQRRTIS